MEAKSDMAQEDAMEEADFSEVVRPGGKKDWPSRWVASMALARDREVWPRAL